MTAATDYGRPAPARQRPRRDARARRLCRPACAARCATSFGGAVAGARVVVARSARWHGASTASDANGDLLAVRRPPGRARLRFAADGLRRASIGSSRCPRRGATVDVTLARGERRRRHRASPPTARRAPVRRSTCGTDPATNGAAADAHAVTDEARPLRDPGRRRRPLQRQRLDARRHLLPGRWRRRLAVARHGRRCARRAAHASPRRDRAPQRLRRARRAHRRRRRRGRHPRRQR